MELLIYLVALHFLLDFPLQGDWLSTTKNPNVDRLATTDEDGNVIPGESIWFSSLFGHSYIHAAGVYFLTQNILLFASELMFHFIIDYAKCKKAFGYNVDQLLHISCKFFYLWLLYMGIV